MIYFLLYRFGKKCNNKNIVRFLDMMMMMINSNHRNFGLLFLFLSYYNEIVTTNAFQPIHWNPIFQQLPSNPHQNDDVVPIGQNRILLKQLRKPKWMDNNNNKRNSKMKIAMSTSSNNNNDEDNWIDLTNDGGVQKLILTASESDDNKSISSLLDESNDDDTTTMTMEYKGTIGEANWSTEEVITCWLSEQQGVDDLIDGFRINNINEKKLIDIDNIFTEEFITTTLNVNNKIKCKKLIMASKRLLNTRKEYPSGILFDSNPSFEFTIGNKKGSINKLIQGMQIGIKSMIPGETSLIKCRSDYAYQGEGYRKSNGDVMVPPFATLIFEIKLLVV